jgi:hypothetical protein
VKVLLVLRQDVRIRLAGVEDDRVARDDVQPADLKRLELAALLQVVQVLRDEAEHEAVWLARVLVDHALRPADVLRDPEVAVGVVLDPLVAAASQHAGDVFDQRRVVERRLPHAAGRALLGREEQAVRERVPRRAVEDGQPVPEVVLRREQRHAVRGVGVEVDARDVALVVGTELVPLEEEPPAVVVVRIGARRVIDHEIGVLVRLRLRGLDVVVRGLDVARSRQQRPVRVIAVEADLGRRVLEGLRSLHDRRLDQAAREPVRRRVARRLGDRRGLRAQRRAREQRSRADREARPAPLPIADTFEHESSVFASDESRTIAGNGSVRTRCFRAMKRK